MTATTEQPKAKTPDRAELEAVLNRAHGGDPTAVPALRRLLDENPDLATSIGCLAVHARRSVIALAAGSNLLAQEAINHQADALQARQLDESSTELEKLLASRLVLCWLSASHADLDLTARLQNGTGADAGTAAAVKRLDRANARFLAASKVLATVRRLLKRGLSALDFVRASIPEGPSGGIPDRVRGRGMVAAAAN
jgi:hypothetical protein